MFVLFVERRRGRGVVMFLTLVEQVHMLNLYLYKTGE